MRRIPLWATLIPLAVALLGYRLWWAGQRDAFQAQLQQVFPVSTVALGGFPYRLEAEISKPSVRRDGDIFAQLAADSLVVNRQPWDSDLILGHMVKPRVQLAVPSVAGLRFDIEAASLQTSLRAGDERIERLSGVYDDARIWFAMLPAPAAAARFELHFRETPVTADPASRSPTPPEQAQVVLSGEALRFGGGGDPLTFSANIGVTSAAPVRDIAALRSGGTIELRRMTLTDKTGEVLTMSATASLGSNGGVQVAGTVETVCPFTVQAAFRGRPAPAEEQRARKPVKLAFRGQPGDFDLIMPTGGLSRVPVRSQEPPCPVLRR